MSVKCSENGLPQAVLIVPHINENYLKEQGWATMSGEAAPDNRVATECANRLMLLDE
jgi:hypothetical protein